MIRVEVTSEADVTRMVAAFQVLESLRDQDYEIWLVPHSLYRTSLEHEAVRRAWREDSRRGGGEYAAEPDAIHYGGSGHPGAVSVRGGTGGSSSLPPYGPNPPGGNGGTGQPRMVGGGGNGDA